LKTGTSLSVIIISGNTIRQKEKEKEKKEN